MKLKWFEMQNNDLFRVTLYYTDYTLSGYELDRITHVDRLGVYMDPKLKFSDYVTTMVNKASSVLGFIKRQKRWLFG